MASESACQCRGSLRVLVDAALTRHGAYACPRPLLQKSIPPRGRKPLRVRLPGRARNPRSPSPSPSPICRGSGMGARRVPFPICRGSGPPPSSSPICRGSGAHPHHHPPICRGSGIIPIPVGFRALLPGLGVQTVPPRSLLQVVFHGPADRLCEWGSLPAAGS